MSKHGKKVIGQGALTNWRPRGKDKSGYRMKATEPEALTFWRPQREAQVRRWKESNWARGTHSLETTE